MTSSVTVLDEPLLVFRHGQRAVEPHDGLMLFGAFDADQPGHPGAMSYGLVGTPSGCDAARLWFEDMSGYLPGDPDNERLWPDFPGFEAVMGTAWPSTPTREKQLDVAALTTDARLADESQRAAAVVTHYLDALSAFRQSDQKFDVVLCVVPDIVYENCRPKSFVKDAVGDRPSRVERAARVAGQGNLFEQYDPDVYQYSTDFRRQLKARAMEHGIPIQIVRESTFRRSDEHDRERRLTRRSDRAWNLSVALYYKSCGRPWRLASPRDGVCYLGLAYRRADANPSSQAACCAAQLFVDSGDGLVFMGRTGPWYSQKKKEFHLSRDAARELLTGALKTYREQDGRKLEELFIHCRSGLDSDEWRGFQDACPKDVRLVGIRVRKSNYIKLLRGGTRPVMRGTYWRVDGRRCFVWGSGYKPRLRTYDGWEVPKPLQIDVQHGTADIDTVARDILALTKLNYNACKLGETEPVTVGFSDAVGEILVSNPTVTVRRPQFKFYI